MFRVCQQMFSWQDCFFLSKWSHLVGSDSLRPHGYNLSSSSDHRIFQARILNWVDISFSMGSSQPRDQTWISCIAGRYFTLDLPGKPLKYITTSNLRISSALCWRRLWQPTPVLLPGKSHGQRSLVGCSPWGCEYQTRLHFHFSLSCIGEGNGNPLQCSCLENPRDGGAWWAAVYEAVQSWTWLKWLSSSSSSMHTV